MSFYKSIKSLLKHPYGWGYVGAVLTSPYSLYVIKRIVNKEVEGENAWLLALKILSPLIAFNVVKLARMGVEVASLRKKHPMRRIELPSFFEEPTIHLRGEQDISSTMRERYLSCKHVFDINPAPFVKQWTKKPTVPATLIVARRYFALDQYDLGMDYIREGLDLLRGKRAKFSAWDQLALLNVDFACWLGRQLTPHDPTMYMFSSAYAALTNPQRAWYFSELGRRVAVAFESPFKKEMYVFHALLASAQVRSDEEQAWKEAIELVRQDAQWERLGETRTIVRRLANSPFFANTFVFKERPDLEDKGICEKWTVC